MTGHVVCRNQEPVPSLDTLTIAAHAHVRDVDDAALVAAQVHAACRAVLFDDGLLKSLRETAQLDGDAGFVVEGDSAERAAL